MPNRILSALAVACLLATTAPLPTSAQTVDPSPQPSGLAAPSEGHVRLVQVIEASEIGLGSMSAVTFSPERDTLLISGTGAAGEPVLAATSRLGEAQSITPVPAELAAAESLAYDPASEVLIATPTDGTIVSVAAPAGSVPANADPTTALVTGDGLGEPQGVTVSPAGSTLVLDATDGHVLELSEADGSQAVTSEIALEGVDAELSGLAAAPDGHLFALDTGGQTLYEFEDAGILLTTRDVSDAGLNEPQGMVIAPSADPTDDESKNSLYVADSGGESTSSAGVYEFELTATALSAEALAVTTETATLVNTIEGESLDPESPDPSGLGYNSNTDRLIMTDAEIEEDHLNSYPYPGTNGWVLPRDGSTTLSTFDTTDDQCSADGGSPSNVEPVGVTYNPTTNRYFVARDGRNLIWELDSSFEPLRCLATTPFGVADAEGVAYGNGSLFIADGTGAEVWQIGPGPNGVFGIALDSTGPNDDVLINNFDTASLGHTDPEGIEYDPVAGTLYIVSKNENSVITEVTTSGSPVRDITASGVSLLNPRGLALAPGTNGAFQNVYIADARVDNGDNEGAFDGRIYEFDAGSSAPAGPDTTITDGPEGTVTSTDASFSFTGTAGTDSFECQLDGAGFTTCTSPQAYTGLTEGEHTFEVRALDGTTADPTPASRTWTISSDPPPPTGNLLLNPGFESADGNNQPTDWTTNAAFTQSNAAVHSGSFAGLHQSSGNIGYNVQQEIDVTAGSEYAFSGWANIPAQGDTNFNLQIKVRWLDASGTLSTVKIIDLDTTTGGAWTEMSAVATAPAGATQAALLMTLRSLNGSIYVDDFSFGSGAEPEPDTTITDGPEGTVTSPDASFTFTGTAGTTSFECQLDGGGFAACTSPKDYTGLDDGEHTFEVRALNGTTPDPTPASRTWTVEFAPADAISYPAVIRDGQWFLRHGNTATSAPVTTFPYGAATDIPVFGDWDGDGVATPGIVRAGTWHLRNSNSDGPADIVFRYGAATGDIPVVGDWDGDGIDTPGIVRSGTWHLRNSNSDGPAEVTFSFGRGTDLPVVGDWDGDGDDTPGVVRDARWFLRNSNSSGDGDVTFLYGRDTDTPVVGDWDGDGDDTPGVVRDARWFLANEAGANADHTFLYGRSSDIARVWGE